MPRCKKCLLSEVDPAFYKETIANYILRIPQEEQASVETRAKRLQICKDCEKLTNGICQLCGCFVEYRSAKDGAECPQELW